MDARLKHSGMTFFGALQRRALQNNPETVSRTIYFESGSECKEAAAKSQAEIPLLKTGRRKNVGQKNIRDRV
jgi:hypothetical protein